MSRQQRHQNPILIIITIVLILLIVSLVKNAIGLYQSRNRLDNVQRTTQLLHQQKAELQQNIDLQSNPASLDQLIRNKLNLSLPGETVIFVPSTPSAFQTIPNPSPQASPPPYLQWWHLFTR